MFAIRVSMSGFQIPDTAWHTADMPNPLESLARIISKGQATAATRKAAHLQ